MEDETPPTIDIEELLQRMRPPSIPNDVFVQSNAALWQITAWRKLYVASVLSGLLTEPQYYANGIRLDWLQQLVISKSDGRRKPNSAALTRALNAGLETAGVLRLEDPGEDQLVPSPFLRRRRGAFRIFAGQWEDAGRYTETLMEAFHRLPDGGLKVDTLKAVYSLLLLSDALAARAGVDASTASQGEPQGILGLPDTTALDRLARRVKFTDRGFKSVFEIDRNALSPFFLNQEHHEFVSDRPIGNTPLKFYPLVSIQTGITVISPAGISLAIRAVLIQAAQSGGMNTVLLDALMQVQEEYGESSGFWPVTRLRLSPPYLHNFRASVFEFAPGRFMHVIQVPAAFTGFPREGFGSLRALGDEESRFIGDDVSRFWRHVGERPHCRQAVTVLLFSGWGAPRSGSLPLSMKRMRRPIGHISR